MEPTASTPIDNPADMSKDEFEMPRTSLEVNGTYQNDSHPSTKETLALNVILHVFFDTSRSQQPRRNAA